MVTDMLKISMIENESRRQLVLEGKLVPPWTDELRNICIEPQIRSNHTELIVDIRGLTVISREGEDVLLALMLQGARFRGSDVFTSQILRQLAKRAKESGNGDRAKNQG
jgi:anti-anti-sigma regulatory factor